MTDQIGIFDGHNDFLLRLLRAPGLRDKIWLTGEGKGHLDLPRMKAGGMIGGFFAVYIPSPPEPAMIDMDRAMENPPYDLPLPAPVPLSAAQPVAAAMIGHLMWMERTGTLTICRSSAALRQMVRVPVRSIHIRCPIIAAATGWAAESGTGAGSGRS